MPYRTLAPGQTARIHVHDVETGEDVVVHEDAEILFEAPNWSVDGRYLLVNGHGELWSLRPEAGSAPERIPFRGLPAINNDHVLDPAGGDVFLSADDGHIYRGPLTGGEVSRVTTADGVWHFLHGVSPDGRTLAYVRMRSFDEPGLLAVVGTDGSGETVVDTGPGHVDGPEWSPDGRWIYFNTERWADRTGHAQLARVPSSGGEMERLLESGTVDWFPHLSPDGRRAVYLEFPAGTVGHPADLPVTLVVVEVTDWSTPLERIAVPGGQGTINVNSWAPDSRRFAYVSYPNG